MRKLSLREASQPICLIPQPFFFVLDETSTILYYDAAGIPKRYAPSRQLPNGEWSYALSPFRHSPSLSGIRLAAHQAEIASLWSPL